MWRKSTTEPLRAKPWPWRPDEFGSWVGTGCSFATRLVGTSFFCQPILNNPNNIVKCSGFVMLFSYGLTVKFLMLFDFARKKVERVTSLELECQSIDIHFPGEAERNPQSFKVGSVARKSSKFDPPRFKRKNGQERSQGVLSITFLFFAAPFFVKQRWNMKLFIDF